MLPSISNEFAFDLAPKMEKNFNFKILEYEMVIKEKLQSLPYIWDKEDNEHEYR